MDSNQTNSTASTEVINDATMAPVVPPQEKKRIIKKKLVKVSKSTEDLTEDLTEDESKDLNSIIPSSRIKNYINKEILNKEIDHIIRKIKNDTDGSLDLNSILSESVQKKIGSSIKEHEKKNQDHPDEATEVNINKTAIEVLSKCRFKFSNTSFKILSVFSDMIIEEITKFAMDELVNNKKSIINNKYVFSSDIETGRLYSIYSKLPSFIAMKSESTSTEVDAEVEVEGDVVESTEPTVEDDTVVEEKTTKSINFEFYIRKICNKLKVSDEMYSKIKVSEKYQKFCSSIILDFLDRIAPLSKIVLEVMTTKTITNLVFQTVIKMQLWDSPEYDSIIGELTKRLPSVEHDTVSE